MHSAPSRRRLFHQRTNTVSNHLTTDTEVHIRGIRMDLTLGNPRMLALIAVAMLAGACVQETSPLREGMVRIEGILTNEGIECRAMRGGSGELYTLAGDLAGLNPDDRICVEGTVAEFSICQQGTTIDVERVILGACDR